MSEPQIKVKAMLIAPNADGTAHVVSELPPSRENPQGFHRLIGGSVEFGETHREAVVREVREELGAEVRDLRFVDVVENLFEDDGRPGHEIVFVYTGRLDPEPPLSGGTLTEIDGAVLPLVWRPFSDADEPLPLFPAGVAERWAGGAASKNWAGHDGAAEHDSQSNGANSRLERNRS